MFRSSLQSFTGRLASTKVDKTKMAHVHRQLERDGDEGLAVQLSFSDEEADEDPYPEYPDDDPYHIPSDTELGSLESSSWTKDGYLNTRSTPRKVLLTMLRHPKLETFFDVTFLFDDDEKVNAHKVVLAAASPVFETMFTNGMKESGKNEHVNIRNPEWTKESCRMIVDYIYSGHIELNDLDDTLSIIHFACMYQVVDLIKFLERFVLETMDSDHCLQVHSVACQYNLDELEEASSRMMRRCFEELASGDSIGDCPENVFRELIVSGELMVKTERTVADAIVSWADADIEERSGKVDELMSLVRWSNLSEADLLTMSKDAITKSSSIKFAKMCLKEYVERTPRETDHNLIAKMSKLKAPRRNRMFTFAFWVTPSIANKSDTISSEYIRDHAGKYEWCVDVKWPYREEPVVISLCAAQLDQKRVLHETISFETIVYNFDDPQNSVINCRECRGFLALEDHNDTPGLPLHDLLDFEKGFCRGQPKAFLVGANIAFQK